MTSHQKNILGTLTIVFLGAILFTKTGTDHWKIPLLFGLIFGAAWYFKK